MKLSLSHALLHAGLLTFASALPADNTYLTRPSNPDSALDTVTLSVNGTDIVQRDPATGWCNFNVGLIEHFPRGGSTGGRMASVKIGGMWDGNSKPIVGYTWDNGDPSDTERRIDN